MKQLGAHYFSAVKIGFREVICRSKNKHDVGEKRLNNGSFIIFVNCRNYALFCFKNIVDDFCYVSLTGIFSVFFIVVVFLSFMLFGDIRLNISIKISPLCYI